MLYFVLCDAHLGEVLVVGGQVEVGGRVGGIDGA